MYCLQECKLQSEMKETMRQIVKNNKDLTKGCMEKILKIRASIATQVNEMRFLLGVKRYRQKKNTEKKNKKYR